MSEAGEPCAPSTPSTSPRDDGTTPPATRFRTRASARSIGAAALGMTVYELDEGQSICPYHYEYPEEEWLLVLEGTPTLRDPDGEHVLAPGDVVCFPRAPRAPTRSRTDADEPARVAMLSTKPKTSVAVYPDSDKVGVWPLKQALPPVRRRRLLGRRALERQRPLRRACTGESAGAHEQIGETSPLLPFSCR